MCLAALALDAHRRFPLVVAANRDEFFHRPTAPLDWWRPVDAQHAILGGRDLQGGGTWLGLTSAGRLAFLTNVRRPGEVAVDGPSRGLIVPSWLEARLAADKFWPRVALSGFAPFNLVAADFAHGDCFWVTSELACGRRLERGVTVISNAAALDPPWPKAQALKGGLERVLGEADEDTPIDRVALQLFALLADRTVASDEALPSTGLPLEVERQLSSAFIRTPDGTYGTRSTTLLITERDGRLQRTHVLERSFHGDGRAPTLRRTLLQDWPPRLRTVGDAVAAAKSSSPDDERFPVHDAEIPGLLGERPDEALLHPRRAFEGER